MRNDLRPKRVCKWLFAGKMRSETAVLAEHGHENTFLALDPEYSGWFAQAGDCPWQTNQVRLPTWKSCGFVGAIERLVLEAAEFCG